MSKNNVYKRIISSGWASSKYNFMKYNVLLRYTLSRSVVIVMLSYYHTQVCFENMSFNKSRSNHLRCSVCVYLCICVCLCVCVCVCVCVCLCILFHREVFFRLQDVWDILEGYGSTMLCCEYHSRCFDQVPRSPFLKMSIFHLQRQNSTTRTNWREMRWYI